MIDIDRCRDLEDPCHGLYMLFYDSTTTDFRSIVFIMGWLVGKIYWHDIHYEIGGEVITYTYIAMQKYNTKTSQPRSMVTVAGPDSIQSRKK